MIQYNVSFYNFELQFSLILVKNGLWGCVILALSSFSVFLSFHRTKSDVLKVDQRFMELVQYKEEEEEEEKDVGIKVIKWHWVQRIQISRWPYIEFFLSYVNFNKALNLPTSQEERKGLVWLKRNFCNMRIHNIHSYLIFVIFFTQAKFLENKIYTEIYTVNCQFTQ